MQHIRREATPYGGSTLLQKGHIPVILGNPVTTARPIRFAPCATLILAQLSRAAGFVRLGMGRAVPPQDVKSLSDALELHDNARDGDSRHLLRPAIMALRRLRREDPWNAKTAVYLGSAYAIAGSYDSSTSPEPYIILTSPSTLLQTALRCACYAHRCKNNCQGSLGAEGRDQRYTRAAPDIPLDQGFRPRHSVSHGAYLRFSHSDCPKSR